MLVNHERDKLINAIKFFSANTKNCGKIKLFKLLYFLDFEHFKETGRSVTGLEYYAWPKGPCPKALFDELENPRPDLIEQLDLKKIPWGSSGDKKWILSIVPRSDFDSSHFSRRELKIMERLADEHHAANAESMVEATHLENAPWHQIYEVDGLRNGLIPYDLAFRKQEAEEMRAHVREEREFWSGL